MSVIQSGDSTATMLVGANSRAARVTLYDANGNLMNLTDRGVVTPGGVIGSPIMGTDHRAVRVARTSRDGTLRTTADALLLFDSVEGAAVDSNKWVSTATTMTAAQGAATGIQLNSGSSVATTVGIMLLSHRWFPVIHRQGLAFQAKVRATAHFSNNLMEFGFGTPASATSTTAGNGAFWRKDGTGQWFPVVSVGGAEIVGTPIAAATFVAAVPATDYFNLDVQIYDERCTFVITTQSGVLVNYQDIEFAGTGVAHFSASHVQAMLRTYNTGGTGTAVQAFIMAVCVYAIDAQSGREWRAAMSGMNYNALTSPTAYTQLANWTNVVAPTLRTPSNTAAGETTWGGVCLWNNAGTSFAASETLDLILFGASVPSPLTFFLTGLRISSMNQGAANGAAPYTIQYGASFNASAVSLATGGTYPPMRVALGYQTLAASAVIGAVFDRDTEWRPQTPIAIQPGRFWTLMARVIGGSLGTASQAIRTACVVDGYFE
jgi:hypothetical protein